MDKEVIEDRRGEKLKKLPLSGEIPGRKELPADERRAKLQSLVDTWEKEMRSGRLTHEAALDAYARAKAELLATAESQEKPDPEVEVREIIERAEAENERWNEDAENQQAVEDARSKVGPGRTEVRYGAPLPDGGRFSDLPNARGGDIEGFGRYVRSIVSTGLPPAESRDATEGSDVSGGFLVPDKYSAPILDLAVNKLVARQAGARVVPMSSRDQFVAKLESDPVPAWRNESAAIVESDAVFGQVQLTARSLAVHTEVSLELLEDSPQNFNALLSESFGRAFALELDRVSLYGSGVAPQPEGLKNASGVTITPFVGANGGTISSTNYQGLLDTVARLKNKNYNPSAIIYSPRTEAQIAGLKDATTGEPFTIPSYFAQASQHIVSGVVPNNLTVGTSNDCSDVIVGDFSYLLLGIRTSFSVMALREPLMLSKGHVALVGWLRADVAVARTAAFEVLTGLRA